VNAENRDSFLQRDSAEHEEYAEAQSIGNQKVTEADDADLLERILSGDVVRV
jgi:hypothetical protein